MGNELNEKVLKQIEHCYDVRNEARALLDAYDLVASAYRNSYLIAQEMIHILNDFMEKNPNESVSANAEKEVAK